MSAPSPFLQCCRSTLYSRCSLWRDCCLRVQHSADWCWSNTKTLGTKEMNWLRHRLTHTGGKSGTGETNQDDHKGEKTRERHELTQCDTLGWTLQNKTGQKPPTSLIKPRKIFLFFFFFFFFYKNKCLKCILRPKRACFLFFWYE